MSPHKFFQITTHKLAHRDYERLVRWNPERQRPEYWSFIYAEWRPEMSRDILPDRIVKWHDTWAEPTVEARIS